MHANYRTIFLDIQSRQLPKAYECVKVSLELIDNLTWFFSSDVPKNLV